MASTKRAKVSHAIVATRVYLHGEAAEEGVARLDAHHGEGDRLEALVEEPRLRRRLGRAWLGLRSGLWSGLGLGLGLGRNVRAGLSWGRIRAGLVWGKVRGGELGILIILQYQVWTIVFDFLQTSILAQ